MFIKIRHYWLALTGLYINKKREPTNKKILWNGRLIRKLLFTIIVTDPEDFILKDKLVIYTQIFIDLYN